MQISDILNILLLQVVIIWGIDGTDFMHSVKRSLGIWTGWEPRRLRPFDCSLCACFWAGVLYVIINGLPWQAVGIVALGSHMSKWVAAVLGTVLNLLLALNERINRIIDKLWKTTESD